jgi:hypothetical protein
MSLRLRFWIGGLAGALAASALIPWGPDLREVGPGVLVLGWALVGIAGEVVALVRAARARPSGRTPIDPRPADGEVGLAPMRGVRAEPNARDGRFRRFVATEGDGPPAAEGLSRARRSPPLVGRVVLLSVFIGRDGRGWSDEEIARAHAAMERAGRWVEREAIRWGAAVNLELADTYFAVDDPEPDDVEVTFVPQGDEVGPFEARAATKALIDTSRAAARLGFRDAADWLARINPRVEADHRVWLLHPRRGGRSLAVPLDDTELAGVSLAVCYAREASFPEPLAGPPFTDPVTVVHELLHLFGATDKYGVSLRSFAPRTVTSRDVMRLNESALSRLRIDPATAREIGWGGK